MNEFDLAWSVLKGLPEQQMFSEEYEPPKIMNQEGRRRTRMGTVHPAIAGLLAREHAYTPPYGSPNLKVAPEEVRGFSGDSPLDWHGPDIQVSQGLHEKWYPGKRRGKWGTEGEDVAYDDTPKPGSPQDTLDQYDSKEHGNDIDQYMAENDPATRRKLEEERKARERSERDTQENFRRLLEEYEPEQFLDHQDGVTPIQRQRGMLEDMARELATARGMSDPRESGGY